MTWALGLMKLVPMWLVVAVLMGAALLYQSNRTSYWERQVDQRDVRIARMKTDAAEELAAFQQRVRAVSELKAIQAEEIAHATDKRIADAAARAAGAERAAVGLRGEIARLNARTAPTDPGAAAFAGEARVARELLGSCAAEYTGLAAAADGLRSQVMGLQEFAVGPAGAGK